MNGWDLPNPGESWFEGEKPYNEERETKDLQQNCCYSPCC